MPYSLNWRAPCPSFTQKDSCYWNIARSLKHWVLSTIDSHLLWSLLAGLFPGILLGSCIVVGVSEPVQRFGLAEILIIVAKRLVQ